MVGRLGRGNAIHTDRLRIGEIEPHSQPGGEVQSPSLLPRIGVLGEGVGVRFY